MRVYHRITSAVAIALTLGVAPVGSVSAQTTTMDFSGLGLANYDNIPATYGSHANLNITNRTRDALGAGAVNDCGSTSGVSYWDFDYSDLVDVGFACDPIGVGEFLFTPAAGYSVTLDYMHIGSWFATAGVGPLRNYDIRVYDLSWNLLFGQTGTVTTSQQVTFNTTSTSGLYLQWGSDWDVGVDNITTTVSPTATVPEPATLALIVPAAAGLFALARRRRRAA